MTVVNDPGVSQLVQDECTEYQSMVEDKISSKIWEESAMEKGRILYGILEKQIPKSFCHCYHRSRCGSQ